MTPSPATTQRSTTAGRIVRRARELTGLSQTDLAVRMGVPQTTISAYERGLRSPTVATLERMVDAAGLRLTWSLAHGGSGGGPLAALTGPLGRRLVERRDAVITELAERGFTGARVVGSVADGTERPDDPLVIVVDDGDHSVVTMLSASGMLRLLIGRPTVVIQEGDIAREGLDQNDLAQAVPLDATPTK